MTAVGPQELHREAIVIDGLDFSAPTRERFLRIRAAGLTAVHVTIAAYESFEGAVRNIVRWERALAENGDIVRQVLSVEDIHAAKREGKVGIIYGFQNATPIEDELGYVQLFRKLGVRVVQLAYMYQNLVGAGCLEVKDSGLSSFGADLVRELNSEGIAVDLSHCGRQTTLDAIAVSSQPVLFTHANPRALVDVARNKSDEELRALAEKGGVVGAVAFPTFVAAKDPTLDDWFRHVDYLVELLGVDHVAIGTDFVEGQREGFLDRGIGRYAPAGLVPRWPWVYPAGFQTVDDFPNVTAGLLARGYREDMIRKILGGNLIRVWSQIWSSVADRCATR